MSKNFYPLIGFSSGDPNGIGLEVLLKSLSDSTLCNEFKPIVFVNHKLIESQNEFFKTNCQITQINNFEEASSGLVNVCLLYTSPSPRDRG